MEAATIEKVSSREQYVVLAKLAEQAGRYDEMAGFMRSLVVSAEPSSSELSPEERGLLSASLKHVVGSLRAAWRIVSSLERGRGAEEAALARAYRSSVEARLSEACASVLGLLDSHLLPSATGAESRVFFLKMKGDYHRYLTEFQSGDQRASSANQTMASYLPAQELAEAELPARHPLRLGLALNFSVFYYEILDEHDKACSLAKQAFEDALGESDSVVDESSTEDTTLILQLMRDNLSTWTTDMQHFAMQDHWGREIEGKAI